MLEAYYSAKLYPLQDEVLRIAEEINTLFYLTGGTALSRAYFHHRFSDDLDFFMNNNDNFTTEVDRFIEALKKNFPETIVESLQQSYAKVFVIKEGVKLKIDFVNDVGFRYGEPINTSLFAYTDNLRNILSNKLCALSRLAAKDVADIVWISLSLDFTWLEIMDEAQKKDNWVNEVDVMNTLKEFPIELAASKVAWIKGFDEFIFKQRLATILKNISRKERNTLFIQTD